MPKKQIVRIKGLDQLQGKLKSLSAVSRGPVLKNALIAGGTVIQAEAAALAAYRSGTLRRSIVIEIRTSGRLTLVRIGTNLIYGPQVEFGGVIEPKTKPYLRFQINGRWVRVKRVTQDARPFLRPAFDNKQGEAVGKITEALVTQIMAIAR